MSHTSPVSPASTLSTGERRIVPVVVIDEPATAAPLGEVLVAEGISAVEVALRSPKALAALAALREAAPSLLVGAGTVLTVDDVLRSQDAGAQFVVSPGLDDAVARACSRAGLEILPGVATPTELQQALNLGFTAVKIFPVAQLGGPAYLRALAGPFPQARFFPSGGVTADLVADYFAVSQVVAVGCSWVVPREALLAGDLITISQMARTAVTACSAATSDAPRNDDA